MKKLQWIGFVVFVVGLTVAGLCGAFPVPNAAALPLDQKFWTWMSGVGFYYLLGMVCIIAGGVMMRGKPDHEAEARAADPKELLKTIVEVVRAELDKEVPDLDRLSDTQNNEIEAFIDQRARLTRQLGIGKYAELMSSFASGERGLARAWSAGTDGVMHETTPNLERSLASFERAHAML